MLPCFGWSVVSFFSDGEASIVRINITESRFNKLHALMDGEASSSEKDECGGQSTKHLATSSDIFIPEFLTAGNLSRDYRVATPCINGVWRGRNATNWA